MLQCDNLCGINSVTALTTRKMITRGRKVLISELFFIPAKISQPAFIHEGRGIKT